MPRALRTSLIPLFLAGLPLSAEALAQGPTPEPRQVRVERNYPGPYRESVSRELFSACDANSDDRLDIFEAADALHRLRAPSDTDGFARIDTDRSGFLGWPEFDQLFRRALQRGGTFRVRTCRPFVLPPAGPQPLTPLQQFLKLHDIDGDGGLSKEELDKLMKALGLPPALSGHLHSLDVDQSGLVSEAELAPWFQLLPQATRQAAAGASALPPPWLDADTDADGAIDARELQQVLRRIDPSLLRWTKALHAKLDLDKDGKLSQTELPNPDGATVEPQPATDVPPRPPQR